MLAAKPPTSTRFPAGNETEAVVSDRRAALRATLGCLALAPREPETPNDAPLLRHVARDRCQRARLSCNDGVRALSLRPATPLCVAANTPDFQAAVTAQPQRSEVPHASRRGQNLPEDLDALSSKVGSKRSVLGRAPTVRRVQGRPHEQTQRLPDVHYNGSVVRQLFPESSLGRLADMPGKQEINAARTARGRLLGGFY
jgi:hypothetical protein